MGPRSNRKHLDARASTTLLGQRFCTGQIVWLYSCLSSTCKGTENFTGYTTSSFCRVYCRHNEGKFLLLIARRRERRESCTLPTSQPLSRTSLGRTNRESSGVASNWFGEDSFSAQRSLCWPLEAGLRYQVATSSRGHNIKGFPYFP
ncbi:hypothetical protein NPIL_296971 [Nephila pilipes]|uniref:Uncharacterized protein n=1 Tax=Nephila pilipes TaxID=299642 RepID=A0A8X6U6S8_NEPPI|nr:hypothetical protein NPIL_296971 [Nephila pilipes]